MGERGNREGAMPQAKRDSERLPGKKAMDGDVSEQVAGGSAGQQERARGWLVVERLCKQAIDGSDTRLENVSNGCGRGG